MVNPLILRWSINIFSNITTIFRSKAVCKILHWISWGHRSQGPKLQSLFLSLSLFWVAVKPMNQRHSRTVSIHFCLFGVFFVSISVLSKAACANPRGFCDIFFHGHVQSHWYQMDYSGRSYNCSIRGFCTSPQSCKWDNLFSCSSIGLIFNTLGLVRITWNRLYSWLKVLIMR